MVAERDAEAGYGQQCGGHDEMKPNKTEVPQVQRHCSQGQNKGADQERTCRPINPVGRDSENQGKGKLSVQ